MEIHDHDRIELARAIATKAHAGQKRRDGKDYITHPTAVADLLTNDFYNFILKNDPAKGSCFSAAPHVIAAAFLHDVVEDTSVTLEDLRSAGVSEMTIEIVDICTKRAGETYFDFIMRINETRHTGAKAVKLADLRHNMSDLKEGTLKDKYRFAEYQLSYFNH